MALAAVFQACHLVDQIWPIPVRASTEELCLRSAMSALLNQDPESLVDLYGPVRQNLELLASMP